MKKYVKVECVSTFRQTYVIPMDGLQDLNTEVKLNDQLAQEWAMDCITTEQATEFSQKWLGEQIVDTEVLDEEAVLKRFDRDNPELVKEWETERKLKFINSWLVPVKPDK
jgi:hypothetical protein